MRTTIFMKGMLLGILFLLLYPCLAAQVQFPPDKGTYTGDYVFISEPGRYTLEENISHTYPVGVIITSSSVILDGQGRQISPVSSGEPSAGIWIARADAEGNPVTGVTIQNCTITGEVSGIYIEGSDSSEFPWGTRDTDGSIQESGREVKISDTTIRGCTNGIAAFDLEHPGISKSELRDNENGVIISGGSPGISGTIVTGNRQAGITFIQTSGGEIAGCKVEGNADGGIILDEVGGVQIWNNVLDNFENIRTMHSSGIVLNTTLTNGTNIIGGDLIGGNLWSQAGIPVYITSQVSDEDQNGIGDSPYQGRGWTDHLPLVPRGAGYVNVTNLEITPAMPVTTPVPVSTPLSIITGIHAVIAGDTIPTEMKTNTQYQVGLTILNDGSDNWLDIHGVGVRASGDAAVWGPEWLPVPPVIASKQAYTFNFTIQSPKKPGTYELSYQAGRSGQGVSVTFGRPHKIAVTVTE